MRRKNMAMALVLMLGVALAGCQTSSGYYDPVASTAGGMLGGAAGGAALGAIIGAATGNPGSGAAIGAATGAGVGAIGGSIYANDQNRARAQAAQGPPPSSYGSPPGYGPYAPRSYPNSSLSSRASGTAAQLIATKRPALRLP